jgi:hypothetical protein
LPPEMIQKTLIDVPLLQLYEICSHIPSFTGYCQDRNFWLARAQARYGITTQRFVKAEKNPQSDEGIELSGPVAYLSLMTNYLFSKNPKLAPKREAANHEFNDIVDAVISLLHQRAHEQADKSVKYYGLDSNDFKTKTIPAVEIDVLIPAASPEELILAIIEHLKDYGMELLRDRLQTELELLLDSIYTLTEGNATPMRDLASELTYYLVSTFNDGNWLNVEEYSRILPRIG